MFLGASLICRPHKNTNTNVKYEYRDEEAFESISDKLRTEEHTRPRTMVFIFQGLDIRRYFNEPFSLGVCYWACGEGGVIQS